LRDLAFVLAQLIEPFGGHGLRVVAVDRESDWPLVDIALSESPGDALALDATEGEPFANPLRRPHIVRYTDAIPHVVFERERESLQALTNLPPRHDPTATAHWIRQALNHEVSIPLPIVNQLACCLYAAGYTQDLNQAKAIAAVETGSLAAA
jgi:anthranilate phosphoribosyltransferase